MVVEVGFTPSNQGWNTSHSDLGFFYQYQAGSTDYDEYREFLQGGCLPYSEEFESGFAGKDRTWKVSRIMSLIAVGSGLVATVVAWCNVLLPIPAECLWPGLLLPGVMIAFISEGSKFLFFDIAVCRSALWYPSGAESLPTSARSCTLGQSAYAAIAAGSVQLLGLLMVCLKAPKKRELDPDFGVHYRTGAEYDMEAAGADASYSRSDYSSKRPRRGYDRRHIVYEDEPIPEQNKRAEEDDTSVVDEDIYIVETNNARNSTGSTEKPGMTNQKPPLQSSPHFPMNEHISQSRLSVIAKLERISNSSQPDESTLVDQVMTDLDTSFQTSTPGKKAQTPIER